MKIVQCYPFAGPVSISILAILLTGSGFFVSDPGYPLSWNHALMAMPSPLPDTDRQSLPAEDIDGLVFHFQDSSVPPPDHRSYTIELNEKRLSRTVDSYGDILEQNIRTVDEATRKRILELPSHYNIQKCTEEKSRQGCTGGTGRVLTLYRSGQSLFSASAYFCGGERYGDLCGDINGLMHELMQITAGGSVSD